MKEEPAVISIIIIFITVSGINKQNIKLETKVCF